MDHDRLNSRRWNPQKVHYFKNKEDNLPICGCSEAVFDDQYIWNGLEDMRCGNCIRILASQEKKLAQNFSI